MSPDIDLNVLSSVYLCLGYGTHVLIHLDKVFSANGYQKVFYMTLFVRVLRLKRS